MAGNKITRQGVVDDNVFSIGPDYAKQLEVAVEANNAWVKSFASIKAGILEINQAQQQFQKTSNNQQFVQAKALEEQAVKKTTTALTEQEKQSRLLESTKKRLAIAESKQAQELARIRLELQNVNKAVKDQVTQSSKLTTEYQKQEAKLNQIRKAYKDLAIRQEIHGNLTKKETEEMRKLGIEANKIDTALKKVDKSVGQSQRNVGNYQSALQGLGGTFRSLIGAFGVTSGIMIFAQLMKGAVTTVKEFDSGLKNVQKTTGLTSAQVRVLGDDIVNLSRKLETVGTEKLLQYATVAGQLGVKGSANILAFTEALAKLETASNITGEQGGASIARLLTLTDGGVENIADFGDEIVRLGNNFAATEGEILDNATAIAQNTGMYKLARQQVLAYATATKAVGIESEITGSTIGRTLGLIEKALRTGKGLTEISALTGKTVDDLRKQFKEDSGSVFTDLLAGLNNVDKAGGSVNEQLETLGITAIRDQRVIGSLATAGYGTLARAMEDVTNASGALGEEFETASSKLENQFNRLGIAWDNFVLSLESGEGPISKFIISRVQDASKAIDQFAFILENKGNTTMQRANAVGNLLSKTLSFMSPAGYLVRNTFKDVTDETINMDNALQDATIALQEQNKAFIDQHGNLGPLTEAQAEFIKNQKEINILTGQGAFESGGDDFGAATKTIKGLQEDLKNLNEDLLKLNETDKDGIAIKQKEIKVLTDKINAILGVTKGVRQAAKEQKDFNFETSKLINEQKIKFLGDFARDEKNDFDLRQTALKAQADLEIELIEFVQTKKLEKVKKGSEEERNILVQSEIEKQNIIKRYQDSTDSFSIDKIKKQAEQEASIRERLLNEELIAENELFNSTLDQYRTLEEATEAHEKRVADIKKRAAVDAMEAQIKSIELMLATEKLSASERIRLEEAVSKAKKDISDINTETYKKEGKSRKMTEEEIAQAVLEISQELANALADIFAGISQRRIDQYQREIEASDAKYDKLLEDENLYEEDRKRIEETKERARKELERKIAQEKRKQAILDKAMAVVQIGINTAVNISKVIPNPLLIALVAALGAAQLAAVAAMPIPQYAKGTDNHKGGLALVGEERPEVIQEPNKAPYVVSKATVLDLPKGTKVTPSLEEYERLMRASILSSVHISNDKMNDFQARQIFNDNKQLIEKLDSVERTIKKSKANINFRTSKAPDLNWEFFKFQQTNWRS